MKAITEHLTVVVIAVLMAFVGYWLVGWHFGNSQRYTELDDWGWTVWSSAVSAGTWLYFYRICRKLHWLVLPVLGLFSPLIGAILFFPLTPFALVVIWKAALVVFPTGVLTGFIISAATLVFRHRGVLHGNV